MCGCAVGEEARLRAEIREIVPSSAEQQERCDYASGFVENARPSLRCRFLVAGTVADVAATMRARMRERKLAVDERPGAGPSARVFNARRSRVALQVALIAPGRFLFFQARRAPVPPGRTGIDVWIQRR